MTNEEKADAFINSLEGYFCLGEREELTALLDKQDKKQCQRCAEKAAEYVHKNGAYWIEQGVHAACLNATGESDE